MPSHKQPTDTLTRGQLARVLGCNAETIRYYESIKLLPPPARAANGYRIYGPIVTRRLRFLLRARQLGFTIEELRSLLSLVDSEAYTCGEVNAIAVEHLDDVREKLADLRRLATILARIVDQCAGGSVPECPIVEALFACSTADDQ